MRIRQQRIRQGVLYLNNTGSRWIVVSNFEKEKVYVKINGKLIYATAQYYGSFGNFAYACINYKGKKHQVLSFTCFAAQIKQLDNITLN